MLQSLSKVKVADNSGAKVVGIIKNLGSSRKRYGRVGDIVVCSVKSALPNDQVKNHQITKAVIVRTKAPIHRKNGETIYFSENAVVLIRDDLTTKGTRLFGPIPREIREKGFSKIISLAVEVV
ncbi:50S ribosomal protein L14 [Mycoplasma sp. SG1]|uniref:50S ribosomal protein L14 n=1 Tax=Mycoplasma sp. SG1 TaxID=2810348 RepID=UPI0020245A9A|nr:50S ribosomal protein L14 [Mycoplasma sp. SG1]URM52901.1 50S ribosomal protein L14 [Mycoplasma sp. SG1]